MAKYLLNSIKYVPETDTLRIYIMKTASVYEEVMDNVFITRKASNERVKTGVVIYDYKGRKDHDQIRKKLKFLNFEDIDSKI